MLFYSFFKTLQGKEVIVELKNDISIRGQLHSVDQYLNIKLNNINVTEADKYPYLACLKNCFIRGSTVRYVHLPSAEVDPEILQDACRRENEQARLAMQQQDSTKQRAAVQPTPAAAAAATGK